jgi:hypothetical protein
LLEAKSAKVPLLAMGIYALALGQCEPNEPGISCLKLCKPGVRVAFPKQIPIDKALARAGVSVVTNLLLSATFLREVLHNLLSFNTTTVPKCLFAINDAA